MAKALHPGRAGNLDLNVSAIALALKGIRHRETPAHVAPHIDLTCLAPHLSMIRGVKDDPIYFVTDHDDRDRHCNHGRDATGLAGRSDQRPAKVNDGIGFCE